jgi:hypothetical protein
VELLKRNEWSEQSGAILHQLLVLFPGMVLPNLVPNSQFYKPDLAKAVWERVKEPPQAWKTAVEDLDSWVDKNGFSYDLFDFNFMLRGTTLVFVDPVH